MINAMIIIGIARISRPKKEHTMSKARFVIRYSFFCSNTGFAYLNDHIGRALLCQTAARCCCHISHIPTLISVSLPPTRFSTKPSRGKGSTQILNLQIAVKNIHSRCAIQVSTASAIAAQKRTSFVNADVSAELSWSLPLHV